MSTRWGSERRSSGDEYDARWERLAAAGEDPHGEASFVAAFAPATVLDAGCGTGRVAIELARRGIETVGVDLDAGFIERARLKAPDLEWHCADLASVELGRRFDLVVAAGNVMIFLASGSELTVLTNLARHLDPNGHLVTGFQLREDGMALDEFDRLAADAGLLLHVRYATWDMVPYEGGGYAVSMYRMSSLSARPTITSARTALPTGAL